MATPEQRAAHLKHLALFLEAHSMEIIKITDDRVIWQWVPTCEPFESSTFIQAKDQLGYITNHKGE